MSATRSGLGISGAGTLLECGEASADEITRAMLERIAELDGRLNAFITVMADEALAAAREADRRRRAGERGPLLGVPLAIKDLYDTAGTRTTAGSIIRREHVPAADATVVRRLREAGAVPLGKTNMMEFAYGYPHPDVGETANPWDLTHTAGGSSGGSAAAVAAGMACAGLGSDTGGSIRSPAAYCGLSGLKPTYGRVSRAGVVPLSWSLDHAGPLTHTALDTGLLLDAIAGFDPADPASAREAYTPVSAEIGRDVRGLRLGLVEELFSRYVQPEIARVTRAALPDFERLGLEIVPLDLPHSHLVGPAIMPILQAEATSYHWRTLNERPDDYAPATRDNLRLGALVLAKDYVDAQRLRRTIAEEVDAALRKVDALIFPTQPIVAPPLDAYHVAHEGEEDLLDVEIGHTGLANLSGHPALSVFCGLTADGLPAGLQLTGRAFDEATILRIAHAYETATGWPERRPAI